ncbi:MAG: polyamine aminopropyltransferase [Candidatus Zixiibacteriota bacterium]
MSEIKRQGVQIKEQGMDNLWNLWYKELHDGVAGLTLKIDRIHESITSDFQRLEVLENRDFGKLLVLYGSLMVSDRDYNAYNEMISHVPLFSHPSPEKVLIIGGGDCGALTEILKHPEVAGCTMCEIDKMVVEVSKKHFPHLTTGLNDPRARVIYEDGQMFLKKTKEKFDVITLDLSDPVGPAADLFQKPFHQTVFEKLEDDGILVAQAESPIFNQHTLIGMYKNLSDIFPLVRIYTCFMPIYPSGCWAFVLGSKKYDPLKDFDERRYRQLNLKTRYYNAKIHRAAFALPQFLEDLLE